MTFEQALRALKNGRAITRDGWNGKGMFLFVVNGERREAKKLALPSSKVFEPNELVHCGPWIGLRAVDGNVFPWLPSQADLMAEDWAEASK